MNEAAGVEEIATNAERKNFASDQQERSIESVSRLLSSGRPLSEILQSVKLTASRNQAGQPDASSQRVPDTLHTPTETRTHPLEDESTGFPQPTSAADNQVGEDGLAPAIDDGALIAPDLCAQQLTLLTSVREARHATWFRPFGAALFWLIPILSLAVLIFAGKSLIDAGAVQNTTDATARAIIGVLEIGKDQVHKAATTVVTSPNRAEPQQPDSVGPDVAQPIAETALAYLDPSEPEAVQTEPAGPQAAQSDHAERHTVQPDRAEARVTAEQITALLDRGDAFVSMADVNAARLSYERAAAAGNAEAALRLGATFDPDFLTRAGLRNVRGDVNAAQYWYRRARDLEPDQPQLQLQGTEVGRASEHLLTERTPQSPLPSDQARTQRTNREPAKSIRPIGRTLSSQTRRPSPLRERYNRNH